MPTQFFQNFFPVSGFKFITRIFMKADTSCNSKVHTPLPGLFHPHSFCTCKWQQWLHVEYSLT